MQMEPISTHCSHDDSIKHIVEDALWYSQQYYKYHLSTSFLSSDFAIFCIVIASGSQLKHVLITNLLSAT
jgi:hypothetical protein